jgi:hypothetical protein
MNIFIYKKSLSKFYLAHNFSKILQKAAITAKEEYGMVIRSGMGQGIYSRYPAA